MHACIRRYKTQASAEVTRLVREGFLPLISKAPGFIAYYAVEGDKGEWASISIFSTQAQAEQSNRLAAEWVTQSTIGTLTGPPAIIAGELVIQQKS
jgi:hypothetical protein